MFLETWQTQLRGVPVNSHDDAMKAVEMAEEEMKQKAIETFRQYCNHRSNPCDNNCISCGAYKAFVKKLNS